jgi:hypothetical protein
MSWMDIQCLQASGCYLILGPLKPTNIDACRYRERLNEPPEHVILFESN